MSEEFLIERGSLIFGRKRASLETGISEQIIRSILKTLINLEMVEKSTTKSTNRFSCLTICNYEHYQDLSGPSNHQINQQTTSRQPADNQQATSRHQGIG
jgi:5-methylthioribose kinase